MDDKTYMKIAINLANSAKGQTHPNPLVGAVIVKDNAVVGMGAHLKSGEPHAEVHAIRMAGDKAKGATIYVTLEPCSHHGKTPPCADLLVEVGVKRAVIATVDPNPKVAGKGIKRLKDAGIEVNVGLLKEDADSLNEVFYHYIQTKMPYVTLKSASSLDGKIATKTGESKWITGEEARLDSHRYRHENQAILVGVQTVLKDDPSLTTRIQNGGRNPLRIILDSHIRTPLTSKVVCDNEASTWIITLSSTSEEKRARYEAKGVRFITLENRITIPEVLRRLGEEGITTLFVEGGATVNESFLKARAVQKVITYIAPMVIGGEQAASSFMGDGFSTLSEALKLDFVAVERVGCDLKIVSKAKGGI